MKQRCYNKNNKNYKWYGAKGVRVCDSWQTFANFHKWAVNNGYKKGLHLDKDIKGNGKLYSPESCCFVTPKKNIQYNKKINYDIAQEIRNTYMLGCITQWELAKAYKMSQVNVSYIINNKQWV